MSLSPEECTRIITMVQEGRSQRSTTGTVGVSLSTVQRVIQRFQKTGMNIGRPGNGRPRCTTVREDRFIVSNMLKIDILDAVQVRNSLQEVHHNNVSSDTILRRLREADIKRYRPANGPKLLREHRVARLRFAREHIRWTDEDWSRVIFSDESRFCLFTNDGRRRVYRRPAPLLRVSDDSSYYRQACFEEKVPFGGGSIMVWAGISAESRAELVVIENGSLTAPRYVEEILNEHVGPFLVNMVAHSIFMQDNARPHSAHLVNAYIQDVDITRMEWPARSPDLNPIEHLWDEIGRCVKQRSPAAAILRELRNALVEEWSNIDQNRIRKVNSMAHRLNEVIRAITSSWRKYNVLKCQKSFLFAD
ncbi:hypothetical protein ABMA27_001695 [Loxostege sticticalis]|uniref:Transposase n=1 Tax=Loxostege sticticalis TaxID=481309 RepID=A0ABR3HZF2_LOXSC